MLIFGTLGPTGSNHEWVTKRYLAFHQLRHTRIELFMNFDDAFQAMFDGRVHYIRILGTPYIIPRASICNACF